MSDGKPVPTFPDIAPHCEQLVRAADKDRYLATLFAPADKRGPLYALYAFNAEIAGVRDRVREPMAGEIRLQWWRDVLNGERSGEAAANPVAAAVIETIGRFDLPREPLLDLVEAHSFDLYDDPMPTLVALEAYGRKTSSAVFAQAALICGARAEEAARHAGLAWRMAEMLRGFARHASRRQLFVPEEMLARHGARTEDIFVGRSRPELLQALAELRSEARRHIAAFEAQLAEMPARSAPAFLPVALVPGYLAAMERPGYDPFKTTADVPQWRRQWALWRAARRYARLMRG
jgi:phytoene synthase